MTSKELVPVPSKDLALINEPSPCPLFDLEVKTLITRLWRIEMNPKKFPHEKQDARRFIAAELRGQVETLEDPKTPEHAPELPPVDGDETEILPRAFTALTREDLREMMKLSYDDQRAAIRKKMGR